MFTPHRLIVFVSFALALLVSGCETPSSYTADQQPPVESGEIRKSPNDDRQYAALTLPNKLQAVVVSDPSLEVTAVSMAVGVGSFHNPAEYQGLAHYLEHMLFLGTEKYPEPNSFQKFVDQNAGQWNAFTAAEETNYFFQLNAGKIDQALDYFSDYFKSPTFDPQYSDKERNAVNSEWSMGRSQDNRIMYVLSGITANPEHPASQLSVGNLDTLSNRPDAKLQDALLDFYNRYYSANNMKLTIVGKQSVEELKALVEKHFSSIPNKNIPRPEITLPGLTEQQKGKHIHYQSLKDLKLLMVEFPIKDNSDQWRLKANEYINSLVTSEEEGTAGEQLRKAGLVNVLYGYIAPDAYGSDGYLRVIAELTDKGLNERDEVIAAILEYLDLIKQEGVEARYYRELQAMKGKDFENQPKPQPLQQAVSLSSRQFDYPVENLLNADFVYQKFDKKAIRSVLNQLQPENARIWYVSKNEKADEPIPYYEGSYSIRDITSDDFARWEKLAANMTFSLPPENPLFSDRKTPIVDAVYKKPTMIVNQQGAEAWLMHAKHYREDKGYLELHYNVDFARESVKNYVLSSLLNDVFVMQNTTLIDRAARVGLDIGIGLSSEHSQVISINGYSGPQQELFTSLVDHFAGIAISEREFAQVLDRFSLAIANIEKAPPYQQLFRHRERLIQQNSWTNDEILAATKAVTLADLQAYHQQIFENNLVRVYAFGNYREDAIKELTLYAADALRSQKMPDQRYFTPFVTPESDERIVFSDDVDQTDNAFMDAWIGTTKSVQQQANLMLINGILGNEFFTQLRTNEQIGYVVGSAPSNFDDYPMFMLFVQSTNTDLVSIKARMDQFRQDFLVQLQDLPVETLAQLKRSEVAKIQQKPTDFTGEAKEHLLDFHWGRYSFDRKQRFVAALEKATKEDLIDTYKELLTNQQGAYLNIQLKGTDFADKPFAKVK